MTPLKELDAWVLEFRPRGEAELWDIVGRVIVNEAKQTSYLTQENSVLHARVRKLEIALAKEREACAKVAEEYGIARDNHEKKPNTLKETALGTAKHIATLIRGRGET